VPIPSFWAVQADICFIGCADKLIGQARSAAGAEDEPGLSEGAVHLVIPPAGVPEFDGIAARAIELDDNFIKPGLGVTMARRQQKQKSSHPLAQTQLQLIWRGHVKDSGRYKRHSAQRPGCGWESVYVAFGRSVRCRAILVRHDSRSLNAKLDGLTHACSHQIRFCAFPQRF